MILTSQNIERIDVLKEGVTSTSTPGASPQQQFASPVIKWRLNSSQNVGVVLQKKEKQQTFPSRSRRPQPQVSPIHLTRSFGWIKKVLNPSSAA
ncbi:hypothetical protein ACLKA7_014666 [Drosophila subpalustris]